MYYHLMKTIRLHDTHSTRWPDEVQGALRDLRAAVKLTGFSQRQLGDYSTVSNLHASDIDTMLLQAQEFLQVGRNWLASQ